MLGGLLRVVAAALSAGAALVSILSYTGARPAEAGTGTPAAVSRVHRVSLTPAADTATAIGDSVLLAMLVTDARGAALLGVEPSWTTADTSVAMVDPSGVVVARGPGTTSAIVRVGTVEARAGIVVAPRPAGLRFADTLLQVREGERGSATVAVSDARGHAIADAEVRWTSSDAAILTVDSTGQVEGVTPGRGALVVALGELRAELPVEVVPVAASITVLDGEDQRAPAGSPLRLPVAAQIVSRTGRPIAGVEAKFLVRSAGGSATPESDTSDARGVVSAVWALDPVPGRQQLAVAVEGVPVSPVVTAEADPVPANTRVALVGEPPAGTAGEPLTEPIAVRVSDSTGAPVFDVPVAWSAGEGGKADAESARTDSLGIARARWRLGPRAGAQRLRAQVGNPRTLPAFTVTARAAPGAATSLATASGDGQRGRVGTLLVRPVTVRALDRSGNPVPDVPILVTLETGRVSDTLVRTDSAGRASVRWTLGREAGTQRMRVSLAQRTGTTLGITARAAAGPAAKIAFVTAPSAVTVGRAPADSLVVEVLDAHGNPVAVERVTLAATSGTLSPARLVTDRQGRVRVRWVPGRKAGAASLTATVGKLRTTRRVTLRPAP